MALILFSLAAKAIRSSRSDRDNNRNNNEQYFNDSYYSTQQQQQRQQHSGPAYSRNEAMYAPAPATGRRHRRRSRREDRIVGRAERILERRGQGDYNRSLAQPANAPAPHQEYGTTGPQNYYPGPQRSEQYNNNNNNNSSSSRNYNTNNPYYAPPPASVPRSGGSRRSKSQDSAGSDRPLDEPPTYDETVRRAKA